jgi:acyl carrier protein
MMGIKEKIRSFISENFLFGDSKSFKDDASFLEEGVIDSTGVLELVAFIEETFSIIVEDDELIPENLDSLVNIENFLQRKNVP